MKCMKCGRETATEQIFCQDCLLDMEKYPVKPGTAVLLPKRREPSMLRKNSKRRTPSTEDQLKWMRKRIRLLTILLLFALVIIICLAFPAAEHFMDRRVRPGQNYSSIVTTAPSTETVNGSAG